MGHILPQFQEKAGCSYGVVVVAHLAVTFSSRGSQHSYCVGYSRHCRRNLILE